jgi:hypothetical protein
VTSQFGGAVKALEIVAETKRPCKARRPSLHLAYLSKDGGEGIMNSGSNTELRRPRKSAVNLTNHFHCNLAGQRNGDTWAMK